MNYTIENPKGIDVPVQRIQTSLFNRLNWGDVDVYGRVYKNPSKSNVNSLIPEAFVNGEYKDVYLNDSTNATIFFVDGDVHKSDSPDNVFFSCDLKIVCFVDLKKVSPSTQHRADMECEIQFVKEVRKHKIFDLKSVEKGIDNILKGFDTSKIKLSDMQQNHVFAISGTLKYNINDC